MQLRAGGLALAAVITVALAGCSSGTEPGSSASAPTSTIGSELPDFDQFTPAPDGAVNEDTGETIGAHPEAVWDEPSRTAAVATATEAMGKFARPGLDYETWWAELEPLLSEEARSDYSFVDPRNVPASEVTGTGVLVDDSSANVAVVEVPTNAGTYTLTLSRLYGDSPWAAERIMPPEEAS